MRLRAPLRTNCKMSFWRGNNTLKVSAALFVENRQRLLKALNAKGLSEGAVILLEGGKEKTRYNTDAEELAFRQESYFFWAFGVHEPDAYGLLDLKTGKSVLFPPKLHEDYAIWEGAIRPEKYFLDRYEVDEVHFHEKNMIADYLKKLGTKNLLLLKADNTDSGKVLEPAQFPGREQFHTDIDDLYPVIAELRVFKTDKELEVLRYASKIASEAHKEVMRSIKPGLYEYQAESVFKHLSYFSGGCRHIAYTCICGSGPNGAILHYGHAGSPNDKQIHDGDMCLFDMGPEYNCYSSDVTCSFPANGKFTDKQKVIYNAVLDARNAPGVRWTEMHLLAERVILTHLRDAKIVTGDVEEMLKARVGAIFMPHGLGHFMGLDVHDCGGYLGDALERSTLPGLKSLRTTRTLQERMVITIEPGCYFVDTLLDKALVDPKLSKYLNDDVLKTYRGFGGVRIEDDVKRTAIHIFSLEINIY
ncbi:Peptidase M24B and Peptidase M24 domain containing protein [Aphelenchoides bicaudatus]|nr:Peptidase M24B and Peptidase M24 domain containing protein [Aphelenchoides bicaudatus]